MEKNYGITRKQFSEMVRLIGMVSNDEHYGIMLGYMQGIGLIKDQEDELACQEIMAAAVAVVTEIDLIVDEAFESIDTSEREGRS